MPPSFSYQNYPNLWDEILNSTSPEGLRNVRLVNSALRSAVDRRIRHLIMTPCFLESGEEMLDLCEGPEGALLVGYDPVSGVSTATFPDVRFVTPWSDEGRRVFARGDKGPLEPSWSEQRFLTRLTRVLDVRGYFHPHFDPGVIGHLFPRLETVRLTQDASGTYLPFMPFDASTYVLFPNTAGYQVVRVHPVCQACLDEYESDSSLEEFNSPWSTERPVWPAPPHPPGLLEDLLPSRELRRIPQHTSRVVVNLDGHVGDAGQSFHFLYDLPPHVTSLVFILPHLASLHAKGVVEDANANDVVEAMRSSTAKHTVVGAECIGENFENSIRDALKRLTLAEAHFDVDYDINDEYTRTMSSWQRKSYRLRSETLREERRWAEDLHMHGLQDSPEPKPASMSLKQKLDDRLRRLEFITVEEYRKRIGDETAMLHLIQYASAH